MAILSLIEQMPVDRHGDRQEEHGAVPAVRRTRLRLPHHGHILAHGQCHLMRAVRRWSDWVERRTFQYVAIQEVEVWSGRGLIWIGGESLNVLARRVSTGTALRPSV